MYVATRYRDLLVELVEDRLSEFLVFGCENQDELAVLKECRRELRAQRVSRPLERAAGYTVSRTA